MMKTSSKFILFCFLLTFFVLPKNTLAFKLGIITDIHAGNKNVDRESEYNKANKLLAKQYAPYFKRALNQLKLQGVETFLTTGDNTSGNSSKYAKNLIKIAARSGLETFWGKGNHDGSKTSRYFFPNGSYSFVDKNNWRIIFLDSNQGVNNNTVGGINDSQIEWLKAKIAETSDSVLIVMHHPIFRIRDSLPDEVYPEYSRLEGALSESGKVKYVISGHAHLAYQFSKNLNGVQYYINPPLTIKKHLGGYQILDLPEN